MIDLRLKTVLALSPHTDDAELGAGATLARMSAMGVSVGIASFSLCGREELLDESAKAASTLGASPILVKSGGFFGTTRPITEAGFEVREFTTHRQAILDEMVELASEYAPDVVFCPCSTDRHQDHRVIYEEALRAFSCSIFGYILPWNTTDMSGRALSPVDAFDLEKKIKALRHYHSQRTRPYFDEAFIRAWARSEGVRGRLHQYGETFECIRLVM